MSSTNLTAIGGLVLSLIALVILPLWFKRQARKQTEDAERKAAEKEQIKEKAERDAKLAEGEVVSWEKINERLTVTAQEERAAHRERLAELREFYAEETIRTKRQTDEEVTRIKRQTDYERDRDRAEINRLSERVEELTRQINALGAKSER